MKEKPVIFSILAVGLALGTAWAVRGKFGHEQGAAWAGAIGALTVILAARRTDWYNKAFGILMAAAFGWGISGVMSYGVVVGYAKGTDFLNVFYGLLMLFVIGVLYGFLGGGMFGLSLVDSKTVRVRWHSLVAEMVAFGVLTYTILIHQLEWLMTPPRSEMWAACLGAAIALAWYVIRHQHHNALKVAVWSAIGGGFGFAFGNFIQVIGVAAGLGFNFWNVMEYCIGFFGGIGMSYGTFTSSWPLADGEKPAARSNLIPILFVTLLIPFIVWEQSFVTDRFDFIQNRAGSGSTILFIKVIAIMAIFVVTTVTLVRNYILHNRTGTMDAYPMLRQYFLLFTGLYIFLSFLVTGLFVHPPEQYLYIINLIVVFILISRATGRFVVAENKPRVWLTAGLVSVAVIALLAVIAMNSHEGMNGSQVRFEISNQ